MLRKAKKIYSGAHRGATRSAAGTLQTAKDRTGVILEDHPAPPTQQCWYSAVGGALTHPDSELDVSQRVNGPTRERTS